MTKFAVSTEEIAKWIGADWVNQKEFTSSAPFALQGVAPIAEAKSHDVAFFFNPSYKHELPACKAGVLITGHAFVQPLMASGLPLLKKTAILACADPYGALAEVSKKFSFALSSVDHQADPIAAITENKIHPSAVISENVTLGKGVVIYPHVFVGPHCVIGDHTVLFPNVTVYEKTTIGKRCRVHAGVVIGADGFGYAPTIQNGKPVGHRKIYHLGGVVIGDDVEIGANSTIDRGTLGNTKIANQVKIDNLVQIGHNAEIGEGSILCGESGMSGSSKLGKFVYFGAQSGTANQVHVGDYAKIAAYTGVAKNVESGAEMGGIPARTLSEHYKILALLSKLLRDRKKGRKE